MARRRGGIKIVWLAWFSDSIALWQRQNETPYLLDDPLHPAPQYGPGHHTTMTNASIEVGGNGDHIRKTDLAANEDDWDQEPSDMKEPGTLELDSINWDDINDEVEAAMNESDDDEGDVKSERSYSVASGHVSEDESDGNSISGLVLSTSCCPAILIDYVFIRGPSPSQEPNNRKRPRSETPPSVRGVINGKSDDDLRSPLAKRKRLVSERSDSRLKQEITAEELAQSEAETASSGSSSAVGTPAAVPKTDPTDMEQDEEEEEDSDDSDESSTESDDSSEEEQEEDDFLARALEEEDMG